MERQDRGWPGEVRRAVIGFLVASGIVGLVAVAVFYFLPGLLGTPGSNWSSADNGSIEIFYLSEDFPDFEAGSYLSEAVRQKHDIINRLDIEEDEIPDRIRIYFHKDLNALRAAIAERKSSSEIEVPLAVIDVIAGYELEPVMVRLLTYFSWGQPSSEFLRLGLQAYFSDRVGNPHLRVAGLGGDVFSFSEIASLSKTDNIPLTLHDRIYDSFDSPYAPAGMSLLDFSRLMRSEVGESPYRYEIEAEAASIVSYLLDKYGVDRFQVLWRSDQWLEDIKRVYGVPPKELEEAWHDFVRQKREENSHYKYYRAKTLYSQGMLGKALNLLKDRSGEDLTAKDLFLKARIYFYRGEWFDARRLLSDLEKRELSRSMSVGIETYADLVKVYGGGTKKEVQGLTIFGSGDTGSFDRIIKECSRVVKKAESKVPDIAQKLVPLRIFVDNEVSGRGEWDRLDHPNGIAFGSRSEDLGFKIAQLVVSGMSRTPTYSNLLRRGLTNFLMSSDAFNQAKKVVTRGTWASLSSITVGLDIESKSSVEAASFVGYILSTYGPDKFARIWYLTTPLGGDNSLETGLNEVVGKRLGEVEADLKSFLETYGE